MAFLWLFMMACTHGLFLTTIITDAPFAAHLHHSHDTHFFYSGHLLGLGLVRNSAASV